jgi:hypothetical protein
MPAFVPRGFERLAVALAPAAREVKFRAAADPEDDDEEEAEPEAEADAEAGSEAAESQDPGDRKRGGKKKRKKRAKKPAAKRGKVGRPSSKKVSGSRRRRRRRRRRHLRWRSLCAVKSAFEDASGVGPLAKLWRPLKVRVACPPSPSRHHRAGSAAGDLPPARAAVVPAAPAVEALHRVGVPGQRGEHARATAH